MSYKHGFDKKCNGHKLCAKSRFCPTYLPTGSCTGRVPRKNTMVINFQQSCA
ncbi:hypothetical protein GW17_00051651 [Ensete ventricosum]|nr:hypothetical protein GW17_00051651 [Ensete ventricosum]